MQEIRAKSSVVTMCRGFGLRHEIKPDLKSLKCARHISGSETLAGEHHRQVREGETQGGLQPGKGEADQEGVGAVEDAAGEEAAAKARCSSR